MIDATHRRAAALLLCGVFVAGGCGSAMSEQRTQGAGIAGEAVAFRCAATSASHPSCPRHPVRATIEVRRADTRRRVSTVQTDGGGRFRVAVPPGDYELVAGTSDTLLAAPPVPVRVGTGQHTRAQVTFFLRHPLPVPPARAT